MIPYYATRFFCCFFCCFLYVSSTAQTLLTQPVSANYNGMTTANALYDLEQKLFIRCFYPEKALNDALLSDAVFEKVPLAKILEKILLTQRLSYIVYDASNIIIASPEVLNLPITQAFLEQKASLAMPQNADFRAIGDPAAAVVATQATIKGRITDGANDKPLIGVIVRVDGLDNLGEVTDADGAFTLPIPIGTQHLSVQLTGYLPAYESLRIYGDGRLDIQLFQTTVNLNTITIRDAAQRNVRSAQMGVSELSIKQIKQLPAFLGEADVVKTLLTLPGVTTVGEGASGFNVRGGNIDQNLILQDGAAIFNPSHVLGLFSSFNPDAVRKVTLYKGQIPAQFGGRTASVLDVRLKDPNTEHWRMEGGIGLVSTKLMLEGPIVKDRTSVMLGARTTYSTWFLRQLSDIKLKNSAADFYDLTLKIYQKIGQNGSSISLSAYRSNDNFQYSDRFGYGWTTQTGALAWNHFINPKTVLNVGLIYGDNQSRFNDRTDFLPANISNGLTYAKAKINLASEPLPKHNLQTGIEAVRTWTSPEIFERDLNGILQRERVEPQGAGQEIALYANDEFELSKQLSLSVGLRQTFYQQIGKGRVYQYVANQPRIVENIIDSTVYADGATMQTYGGFEPRLSLSYTLNADASLKVSYNRLYQFVQLLSNTSAATPVDIWQVSNTFVKPQSADNFSLGYFANFQQKAWETSLEVYYKKIDNLVEYKDFAQLLRNPHIETELLNAEGRAYGAELYLKRNKGDLTGWCSYAYSRTFRRAQGSATEPSINDGAWYPANFDKPHNLNIALNWLFRKTQSLAVNFTYSTGRPLTAPIGSYNLGNTNQGVYFDYALRNTDRIGDYHRLDVSYTITRGAVRVKRYKSSLTFAVYNLYGRRNPFSIFFKRIENDLNTAFQLSVLGSALPSVSYNFQF
jgi:hypothetical protein